MSNLLTLIVTWVSIVDVEKMLAVIFLVSFLYGKHYLLTCCFRHLFISSCKPCRMQHSSGLKYSFLLTRCVNYLHWCDLQRITGNITATTTAAAYTYLYKLNVYVLNYRKCSVYIFHPVMIKGPVTLLIMQLAVFASSSIQI